LVRILIGILVILLLALQGKAWFGDAGHLEAADLRAQVERQRERAELLDERNRLLTAEVLALKDGYAAVEARARTDLGMVGPDETFYLVPDPADE
jgi:cell division protein FtsB